MSGPRTDRRRFLLGAAAGGAALMLPLRLPTRAARAAQSAPFTRALPIPRQLTGSDLTIRIGAADVPILDGPPTRMWTYDGSFPGPTIRARSGRPLSVTFVHELPEAGHLTVHRHGGHNRSIHDGQPGGVTTDNAEMICDLTPGDAHVETFGTDALIAPGASRRYVYDLREDGAPERAAFEWYHDHRCDVTGRNLWNGLAGMLILEDDVEAALGLPSGEFDVPLMVVDRTFLADNQLADPFYEPGGGGPLATATPQQGLPPSDEIVGDRILVNGTPQPYLAVAARRYRLRLLNAANFSSYNFALSTGEDLVQVATESGLLPAPLRRKSVLLGPAERAEIVVDFAGRQGQTITLRSEPLADASRSGAPVPADVMQFRVTRPGVNDPSRVPARLRPLPAWARELPQFPTRTWVFELGYDEARSRPAWGVNDQVWNPDRVDAFPRAGTTESWQLTNASNVTHVIHLHSADWVTLSRNGEPPPAWEQGLKETWRLEPGESVVVGTKFSDYTGRFVIHCHMLEHEDHGMMTQFEVIGREAPLPAGAKESAPRTSQKQARAAATLGLPAPHHCRDGRLAFRLRAPRGQHIKAARIYVNGRRVRIARGRALRRLISLRLTFRKTTRVTVVAQTASGRRLAATRVYPKGNCRRRRGGT